MKTGIAAARLKRKRRVGMDPAAQVLFLDSSGAVVATLTNAAGETLDWYAWTDAETNTLSVDVVEGETLAGDEVNTALIRSVMRVVYYPDDVEDPRLYGGAGDRQLWSQSSNKVFRFRGLTIAPTGYPAP